MTSPRNITDALVDRASGHAARSGASPGLLVNAHPLPLHGADAMVVTAAQDGDTATTRGGPGGGCRGGAGADGSGGGGGNEGRAYADGGGIGGGNCTTVHVQYWKNTVVGCGISNPITHDERPP